MTSSRTVLSRTALLAAGAALLLWSAKATAIAAAGGLGRSPLEVPLYLAGLLAIIVASVSLGAALTRGRPRWLRIVAGGLLAPLIGVGLAVVVNLVVDAAVGTDPSRHWAWTELNLWLLALLALTLALLVRRRQGAHLPTTTAVPAADTAAETGTAPAS